MFVWQIRGHFIQGGEFTHAVIESRALGSPRGLQKGLHGGLWQTQRRGSSWKLRKEGDKGGSSGIWIFLHFAGKIAVRASEKKPDTQHSQREMFKVQVGLSFPAG